MNNKNSVDDDFRKFQELPSDKSGSDQSAVGSRITDHIRADLVTSKYRLVSYFFLLSVLGYVLTLFICGQYGISVLGSGERAMWFMSYVPHNWCAALCGALFNGIPVLTSFVLLNRFQRRYLLFRLPWLLVAMPVLGCGGLSLISTFFGDGIYYMGESFYFIWISAAILTPYLIEGVAALILRQRSIRPLP